MAHQRRAETLPLIFVDHSERDLGLSRAYNDKAPTAGDRRFAAFLVHAIPDGDERRRSCAVK